MDKTKLTIIEGWLSIIINSLLFILKFWAGTATGSIAIIADAWHTLSDSISSVIVLIGSKYSIKPADKDHPFGHGRAELITSMIIGALLSLIAFSFAKESISRLADHESVNYSTFAIIATVISVITKEALAQYAFWAAKKVNSSVLKADGWHHRSDAISSVVILVGIYLGGYAWWIDGVLGILVAFLILYAAYEILQDSLNQFLGKVPDSQQLIEIMEICNNIAGKDISAHHFHIHEYGDHREMTFHIRLSSETTLMEAHEVASEIERKILEVMDITATIHMEPLRVS
ncbi:MAG: cation diffusion facilitator family transporter [Bacteroidetes bacterium]|nr:cation diffusion facilitator family transporter [Bacteroidota bacterium]